jgi:hypothetical protein
MIKTDNLLIKTRNVFRKTSAFAPPGTQTGHEFSLRLEFFSLRMESVSHLMRTLLAWMRAVREMLYVEMSGQC